MLCKSSTAQAVFLSISGLISCTWVNRRWGVPSHTRKAVGSWLYPLTHVKGGISLRSCPRPHFKTVAMSNHKTCHGHTRREEGFLHPLCLSSSSRRGFPPSLCLSSSSSCKSLWRQCYVWCGLVYAFKVLW